jgi:hypothetical protein
MIYELFALLLFSVIKLKCKTRYLQAPKKIFLIVVLIVESPRNEEKSKIQNNDLVSSEVEHMFHSIDSPALHIFVSLFFT